MRDRIIGSTMDVIERFGMKGFTMDDVAREMGISKKTLYKHFKSKVELLESTVNVWLESEKSLTLQAMEQASSWTDRLKAAMDIYSHRQMSIRLLKEVNHLYPFLSGMVNDLSAFKIEQQRQALLEARAASELNEQLDIEIVLLIMDGIVMNLAQEASRHTRDFSVSSLVETAQCLVLNGIKKDHCPPGNGTVNAG